MIILAFGRDNQQVNATSEEAYTVTMPTAKEERKMQAFKRLDVARAEIRQYLPDDFDPERELEEVRAERYGSIG